jgi:flagellar protein FliO/FliZ
MADNPSEDGGKPAADVLSSGLSNFYLVLEVLFFLAVILGVFFVVVRLLARRNQTGAFGARPVRSIGGVPLGQNKSIQLVAIGKAIYIVGVGDNVQLLEKVEGGQAEELMELLNAQHGAMPEFLTVGNWFKRLRERRMPIEEEELPSASFGQVFQEKLQQISNSKKRTQEQFEHKQNDDDRYDP